jgi:hypothetical protein
VSPLRFDYAVLRELALLKDLYSVLAYSLPDASQLHGKGPGVPRKL